MEKNILIKDTEDVRIKETLKNPKRSIFNWKQEAPFDLVEKGNVQDLKSYLNTHYVRENDDKGNSLMHHAARFNNVEMIKVLKEVGFSLEACNKMGRTPLHIAAELNQAAAMRALLNLGANVEARDINASTPAHLAARSEGIDGLRVLRSFSADFNAIDKWGATPLFHATTSNKPVNVAEIISYGVKVDATNNLGNSPLYYAAWVGWEDVANILCLHEANPTHRNNKGYSPLDIAKEEGHQKMVELLTHFVQQNMLMMLANQMEIRLQHIKKQLEQAPSDSVRNNMLKYNMVRAFSRLADVDRFLNSLDLNGEYKKVEKGVAPQVVSSQPVKANAANSFEMERGSE